MKLIKKCIFLSNIRRCGSGSSSVHAQHVKARFSLSEVHSHTARMSTYTGYVHLLNDGVSLRENVPIVEKRAYKRLSTKACVPFSNVVFQFCFQYSVCMRVCVRVFLNQNKFRPIHQCPKRHLTININ